MGLQTWASLQKSSTDTETIEEAIARLIAVHEADPNSHLGVGESLQAHKNADIIDHPASSIVADKIGGGDVSIMTYFESLSPWNVVGSATIDEWNGLDLYVEYGVTNTSKIYSTRYIPYQMFDQDYDMQFETMGVWSGSNNHVHAWIGFLTDSVNTNTGFGFQIRDGVVKAYLRRNGTSVETSLASIDITVGHVYKAVYSVTDQTVIYSIDGTVVATLNVPAGSNWNDDRVSVLGSTLTQTNDGNWHFNYMFATRKFLTP